MPSNYVKDIVLKLRVDEKTEKEVDEKVKALGKGFNFDDASKSALATSMRIKQEMKGLKSLLSEYEGINTKEAQEMREQLEAQIKAYEEALGLGGTEEASKKGNELGKKLSENISSGLEKVSKKFLEGLKKTFTDAWEELNDMLSYSRLSNANTRNLAFTYGFSASQAYGYSQAMSALGFGSEEDLFYANTQEIELFKKAFEKYSDKYQKLYDEGTFSKLLEFQVEMNEFQQDLKLQVVDFFMQNKDTIKAGLTAIMEIANSLLKITSWLLGTDQENARSAAVAGVVSNYSNQKVTNVSIDNTFNGIDASQRQNLTRLGTMTTQQLIAALK